MKVLPGQKPKIEIMCPKCDHCFEPDEDLRRDLVKQLNLLDPDDLADAAVEAGYIHEDLVLEEATVPEDVLVQLWRDGLVSASCSYLSMRDFLEMYA